MSQTEQERDHIARFWRERAERLEREGAATEECAPSGDEAS